MKLYDGCFYTEVISALMYCLRLGDAVLVHILDDLLEHNFSSGSIRLTPDDFLQILSYV